MIRLKGITRVGKNRIREHGEWWNVSDWVSPLRPGEFFIESVETGDRRWLTSDFEIVEEKA